MQDVRDPNRFLTRSTLDLGCESKRIALSGCARGWLNAELANGKDATATFG